MTCTYILVHTYVRYVHIHTVQQFTTLTVYSRGCCYCVTCGTGYMLVWTMYVLLYSGVYWYTCTYLCAHVIKLSLGTFVLLCVM